MNSPLPVAARLGLLTLALASCSDGGGVTPPPDTGTPNQPNPVVVDGQRLFDVETFGGNGRTCLTCHMTTTGTITVADVGQRLAANPADELFRHDALDNGATGTSRIATHATIRVELELPSHITLADNPAQRTIFVNRGVPSTMNTPAFDGKRGNAVLMADLRNVDLQDQALGAIRGHAQSKVEPTSQQLDALARFQQENSRFFSSASLRAFANSGVRPELPAGPGRDFFLDVVVQPTTKVGACGMCHSGPMLNEVNETRAAGLPVGAKFGNVLVSETNKLGNPTFTLVVQTADGPRTFITPDPGILLTGRKGTHLTAMLPANVDPARLVNVFKTPSLWNVKNTPPYFHDNSAKTLREVVDHYADVFFKEIEVNGVFLTFTEQERQDIVAFLERL